MQNTRIKSEKNDIGFKLDPDGMDIDEEIFSGKGNLNNVQIKHNNDSMNDEDSSEAEEITDKDSWKVISAFFNQHGLVSQQIGSFNQFVHKNIQEIIDENKLISIEPDMNYYKNASQISYELTFGQAHIADHPQFLESNSSTEHIIYPNEARVRNLDYISDLSVDIQFKEKVYNRDEGTYDTISTHDIPKQNIGKIPIMVRSDFCSLKKMSNLKRVDVKECEFDQGGYFIIGGGEKVIVAQERMATNFVYVFEKNEQSGFSWQAEIRSNTDGMNRPPVQFSVKISKKNVFAKNDLGGIITSRIPYIKIDVPIVILFRASFLKYMVFL